MIEVISTGQSHQPLMTPKERKGAQNIPQSRSGQLMTAKGKVLLLPASFTVKHTINIKILCGQCA